MATMNPSSENKSEFLLANCPECQGIIRIPITVRASSTLICPHCNSAVDLSIVLAQEAPEAKLADGPPVSSPSESVSDSVELESIEIQTQEPTAQENGRFVVPPQLAAGARRRKKRRRSSSSSEESKGRSKQRSSSSQPMSEAEEIRRQRRDEHIKKEQEKRKERAERARKAAEIQRHPPASPGRRHSSRRNTPKRNPVVETAKIVVGGLLAIPIAYLLLMWIFVRDPLGLAPSVHSAAPFLVPEAMIAVEEAEEKSLVDPTQEQESNFGTGESEMIDLSIGDG